MSSRKMPKRYTYTLYMKKVESRHKDHLQKGETGQGIGGALYG